MWILPRQERNIFIPGEKKISFVEVITVAHGNYIHKPIMVYTAGYEDGPKENPENSRINGQVAFL